MRDSDRDLLEPPGPPAPARRRRGKVVGEVGGDGRPDSGGEERQHFGHRLVGSDDPCGGTKQVQVNAGGVGPCPVCCPPTA